MSNVLLAITGLIYVGVAIDFFLKGNMGMALSFFAYSLANVGFILANGKTLSPA
jgi:hypothetical protein